MANNDQKPHLQQQNNFAFNPPSAAASTSTSASTSTPTAQAISTGAPSKRRTYRACEHCRLRKLKCDLGDPECPTEGPCKRCRRESRPCILQYAGSIRAQAPVAAKPYSRPKASGDDIGNLVNNGSEKKSGTGPTANPPPSAFLQQHSGSGNNGGATYQVISPPAPTPVPTPPLPPPQKQHPRAESTTSSTDHLNEAQDQDQDAEDDQEDQDILLTSALHNPSDALKLLAFASRLANGGRGESRHRASNGGGVQVGGGKGKGKETTGLDAGEEGVSNEDCWKNWKPVKEGVVDQREAEALFLFFQLQIAPLYPLLTPLIFAPDHLTTLTTTSSLLLSTIICISSRYSPILTPSRGEEIHRSLADRVRDKLGRIMDGDGERHVSSVEALLLLSEWPLLPRERDEGEEGRGLVGVSNRYDSVSWGYIGWAVRLAQELGIHNQATYPGQIEPGGKLPHPWDPERSMRTFIYCYNADRHVSVRLGRDSVVQAFMTSQWWEEVMRRAPGSDRNTSDDVWIQYAVSQGMTAALMGTIQDRLFSNVEITRAMLRTGQWESFLRSLEAELATMRRNASAILREENLSSTLVKIELDYVLLYGNAVTLRALQERLKRRMKAKDSHFKAPSILNLQEGRWIIDALAAAQSILHLTVSVLEPKGYLRLCPARIFQRILFSAVFLFKSLAVGVVEHGQTTLIDLLDRTISALYETSIDENHLSRGFSALLGSHFFVSLLCGDRMLTYCASSNPPGHLQAQCKPRLLSTLHPSGASQSQSPAQQLHALLHPQPSEPVVNKSEDTQMRFAQQLYPTLAPPLAHDPPLAQPLLPSPSQPFNNTTSSSSLFSSNNNMNTAPTTAPPDAPFSWDWDPTSEFIAVGREQDLLFQTLWNDNGLGVGGDIMGTLLGDNFGTGEFGGEF